MAPAVHALLGIVMADGMGCNGDAFFLEKSTWTLCVAQASMGMVWFWCHCP